jgi:methionyl-tRNA synthetase
MVTMATLWTAIAIVVIVEMILKGIALWKAGNNKQLVWFIVLFVLNTAGILPAIYLLLMRKKQNKTKLKKKK